MEVKNIMEAQIKELKIIRDNNQLQMQVAELKGKLAVATEALKAACNNDQRTYERQGRQHILQDGRPGG